MTSAEKKALMQQALEYGDTLDVPYVFSSNGDAFLFHDRTGKSQPVEQELTLDEFPSADDLWQRYCAWKGLTPHQTPVVAQDYCLQGAGQRTAILSGNRHQPHNRGHRQRLEPHPARHGYRHRQDFRRVPDHLATVESRREKAHPFPRRPKHSRGPDSGGRR